MNIKNVIIDVFNKLNNQMKKQELENIFKKQDSEAKNKI